MYLYIVILIDSVYRKHGNYYPQLFLEKYNYVVKEISSDEKVLVKKIKDINLFSEKTRRILEIF